MSRMHIRVSIGIMPLPYDGPMAAQQTQAYLLYLDQRPQSQHNLQIVRTMMQGYWRYVKVQVGVLSGEPTAQV